MISVFKKKTFRILNCCKKNSPHRTESLKGAYSNGDRISETLGSLNATVTKSTENQNNCAHATKIQSLHQLSFTDCEGFKLVCSYNKQYFTFFIWGMARG